jgi:hypothetical protein
MQQCGAYLHTLQRCLQDLGLRHTRCNWTSASGLWCDMLVWLGPGDPPAGGSQLPGRGQPASEQQQQQGGSSGSSSSSSSSSSSPGWLAAHILSPGEMAAGAEPPGGGWPAEPAAAAAALASQLAGACGCFAAGTSARGHPKRQLLRSVSGAARRHVSLLKAGLGCPLVLLPFFELDASGQSVSGAGAQRSRVRVPGSSTSALAYVRAVLQEHGCV